MRAPDSRQNSRKAAVNEKGRLFSRPRRMRRL